MHLNTTNGDNRTQNAKIVLDGTTSIGVNIKYASLKCIYL